MLGGLEFSKDFNKELENIKKDQSALNTFTKIKNTQEGINSKLEV